MIECAAHGEEKVHGLIVCVHVLEGAEAAHLLPPDPEGENDAEQLGEALCATCHAAGDNPNVDDLVLVCVKCVPHLAQAASNEEAE